MYTNTKRLLLLYYYYYSGAPEIKNRVTSICNIPLPTMTQKQNLEIQNRSTTRLRNKTKPKVYWVHGKRGNKCRSMDILLSDRIMLRMGRERVHQHHNIGLKEAFNYLQATHTHTHTHKARSLALSPLAHIAQCQWQTRRRSRSRFFFFSPSRGWLGSLFFSRAMK
jgi:hypothetical protein